METLCGKCNKTKGKEEGSCKCGRPTDYSNKLVDLYSIFSIKNAFNSEKEMHFLIKNNAVNFAKDFLGIELLKFEYEPILKKNKKITI